MPRVLEDGVQGVTIVDNSCSDREWARLEQMFAADSRVHLLRMSSNVGFAAGVNAGVAVTAMSDEDCIWLLNPDTMPESGSVSALTRVLVDGTADIASPVITTGRERDVVWFAGGDLDVARGESHHRGMGVRVGDLRLDARPSTFITGAAMLVSVQAWRALGGLREHYFLYWEDADFCLRAHAAGFLMAVAPESVVWHAVGGATIDSGMSRDYYYFMQRNRVWMMRTAQGGRVSVFTTGGLMTLKNIAIPLVREREARVPKAMAAVRGLIAGLSGALPEPSGSARPGRLDRSRARRIPRPAQWRS